MTIVSGIIDVAYTLNKNVAISLACFILLATWSIITWFWAGGIQDSSKQTNHNMGCSSDVPIRLLLEKGKNFGHEAALSNPSMRAGETTNLDIETRAQRFTKGIVVFVELLLADGFGAVWSLGPNPAPSAKEDTNTRRDKGLAALPKFCAVSNTTPKSDDVAMEDGDVLLPSLTNNLRKIGIVAITIPINTPITGGGNRVLALKSSSSFRVVFLFAGSFVSLSPNKTDLPKLQKKGDQPTRNMETNPVLRARLSFWEAPFRKRESQKIRGTTPAFPKDAHTAVPRASSVALSSGDRKHGYKTSVVKL
mmetsp:Transcript_2906/g.6024  ORF Transcript_2906/g.6024 Transcript_2906/m.6024 type:complete len:307 (+) Transcript_2906:74-994(+)